MAKLADLNHRKHLLVGASLCCGLQSQSPRFPRSFEVAPNCMNHDAPNAKENLKNKNIFDSVCQK